MDWKNMENNKVCVAIPVYRPDEKFIKLMDMLARQTVVPHRVIILETVSDSGESIPKEGNIIDSVVKKQGSVLNTELVKVKKSEFDHGGTRHMAVGLCSEEYILFMTQDAVPADEHLIENLLKVFYEQDKIAVAYARQITDERCVVIERYTREFNYPCKSCVKRKADEAVLGIKTFFSSDACAMYDTRIYNDSNGFRRPVGFAEDTLYAYDSVQNGYGVAYVAKAMVIHYHNYTIKQQYLRNREIGRTHRQYSEIFGRFKSESEGMRMVKTVALKLLREFKFVELVRLIAGSGAKYIGYRKGLRDKK